MATVRVDVDTGGPERMIRAAIDALTPPNVTNALRAAANVYQTGIRSRAPRRTGRLATSFFIDQVGAYEFEVSSGLIYAPVHEFGATIRPVRARALRFTVGSQVVFAQKVTIPARPYVAPTFAQDSDKAFNAFAERVTL